MMTICQMCGDRGFSEALIYCDKCEVYAQHRYCLEVLPRTFDEYVMRYCIDCEPKSAKPKICVNSENVQAEPMVCVNFEILEAKPEVCVNSESVQGKPKVCVNPESVQAEPKFYVNSENVLALNLENVEAKPKVCVNSESVQVKPMVCVTSESVHTTQSKGNNCKKRKRVKSKNRKWKRKDIISSVAKIAQQICENLGSVQAEPKVCVNSESVQAEPKVCVNSESVQAKPKVCVNSESMHTTQSKRKNPKKRGNNRNRKRKRKGITSLMTKTKQQKCEGSSAHQPFRAHCSENCEKDHKFGKQRKLVIEYGGNSNEEIESDKRETFQTTVSDSSNILAHRVPSLPIIYPIWRGSISIHNEQSGTGTKLVAHISNLACQKVWETAKLLPKLLCPELLPRSYAWPKGFQSSGPRDDNIALYFFRGKERDERVFDSLVENMIGRDLALRAVVENAELLVFASTELPLQYWRFQAKLYLWGVFRQRQVSRLENDHVVAREEKDPVKRITWSKRSPTSTFQQW